MHVRSTIKGNLTSAPRQTNSRFLFPLSNRMYLGGQTVYTHMQFYGPRLRLER